MTNFTVKNHFKAENAKLVDATVYQVENGTWYMELLKKLTPSLATY